MTSEDLTHNAPFHRGDQDLTVLVKILSRVILKAASTPGKSAYELAVDAGFEGDQHDWLETLKGAMGPQGEPGKKGDPGERGPEGKSAYEVAKDTGFSGTEKEWIASLKGIQGETGPQGPQGIPGGKGEVGPVGPQGKSAYQVAQESGFKGSEQKWLADLKGPQGEVGPTGPKGDPGDKGDTGKSALDIYNEELKKFGQPAVDNNKFLELIAGAPGDKGDPGERGPEGKSAYELAKESGFKGSEQKWLESLKGSQGLKGDTGEQGLQGPAGPKGDAGSKGDQGIQGPTGPKGDKGDTPSITVGRIDYQYQPNIEVKPTDNGNLSMNISFPKIEKIGTRNLLLNSNFIFNPGTDVENTTANGRFFNGSTGWSNYAGYIKHVVKIEDYTYGAEIANGKYGINFGRDIDLTTTLIREGDRAFFSFYFKNGNIEKLKKEITRDKFGPVGGIYIEGEGQKLTDVWIEENDDAKFSRFVIQFQFVVGKTWSSGTVKPLSVTFRNGMFPDGTIMTWFQMIKSDLLTDWEPAPEDYYRLLSSK